MINAFWLWVTKVAVWSRYRLRVTGLQEVLRRGRRGVLFLPNHPALIDPIILMSILYGPFRLRALADKDQIDRFVIRRLARRIGVLALEESFHGAYAPAEIRRAIVQCVQALKNGDNLLLYPSGHSYRTWREDLRGNSAVRRILNELPDVRVVLVRTHGLWGSSFSRASGNEPSVSRAMLHGLKSLLLSGIFFAPRRKVSIEFVEADDLPRQGDTNTLNRYLEAFYNDGALPNTYVPYTIWRRGGPQRLPEPAGSQLRGDPSAVPPATRRLVTEFLTELTGVGRFDDTSRLAHDLGMDSMAGMDLVTWLNEEFGFPQSDLESLRTVGDVMLAACGEGVSVRPVRLKPAPPRWFGRPSRPKRPDGLADMTIPQAFLLQARRQPGRTILADLTSGVKTFRDLAMGCLALHDELAGLSGERLGLMMPASVGAATLYLGSLLAGKTPALVNWTLGPRNLLACLDGAGVRRIVTSRRFVSRLDEQGVDLAAVRDRFVFLEDIRQRLTRRAKLAAFLRSRLDWRRLRRWARGAPDIAAVLFTSGSESQPKAVPLTHRNILTNVSDIHECVTLRPDDSLLGILPPFHSFGLTTSVVLPLALGLRCVYWPNPADGAAMGQMIERYGATLLTGTPTFLHAIVRASSAERLRTLRLVVSGAEKCSDRIYRDLARQCPQTIVMEGYGATECSPVISVNRENAPQAGSVGPVLPSLAWMLADPDSLAPGRLPVRATGPEGVLLVSGPSVFGGYLDPRAPSPFVELEGRRWYVTGDVVRVDADGVLTFQARRKRFVKLGGEMVSLPAIEAVLEEHFAREDDEGPVLAVVATPDEERPEIVLFTTRPAEREEVNGIIRAAGLSGLHNVRRVIRVDELPLLGTGKCDYLALSERLARE